MLRYWSVPTFKRLLQVILGLGIGLGAFALAINEVQIELLRRQLTSVHAGWLAISIVGVVLVAIAKAVRWRIMFDLQHRWLPYTTLFSAMIIGQALNSLLPFRVGEVARAQVLKRRANVPIALSFGTIIAEKLVDLSYFGVGILLMLFFFDGPPWLNRSALILLTIVVIAVAVILIIGWASRSSGQHLKRVIPERIRERAATSLSNLRKGGSALWEPRIRAQLWIGSMGVWLLSIITPAALAVAMGWMLPLAAIITLLLALQVSFVLPSTPGMIGVVQYLCVLLLPLYGIDKTAAFGYGLYLNAVMVIPLVVGALILGLYEIGRSPRTVSSSS